MPLNFDVHRYRYHTGIVLRVTNDYRVINTGIGYRIVFKGTICPAYQAKSLSLKEKVTDDGEIGISLAGIPGS
jgi:hypothetical protein